MADFFTTIVEAFENIIGFFQTMIQFIIDFGQIWFGMGAYGDLAPPAYLIILLILIFAVGHRIIDDIDLYINNVADALINPRKLDDLVDSLASRLKARKKKE